MEGNNAESNVAVQPPEVVEVAPVETSLEEIIDIIEKAENTFAGIKETHPEDPTLIQQNIDIANASILNIEQAQKLLEVERKRRETQFSKIALCLSRTKRGLLQLATQ